MLTWPRTQGSHFRLGLVPRVLIQEVSLWKNPICGNVNVDDAVTAWRLISLAVAVGFPRQDISEDAEPTQQHLPGMALRKCHHFPDRSYPPSPPLSSACHFSFTRPVSVSFRSFSFFLPEFYSPSFPLLVWNFFFLLILC